MSSIPFGINWARKVQVSLTPKLITSPFVPADEDMGDCACGGSAATIEEDLLPFTFSEERRN